MLSSAPWAWKGKQEEVEKKMLRIRREACAYNWILRMSLCIALLGSAFRPSHAWQAKIKQDTLASRGSDSGTKNSKGAKEGKDTSDKKALVLFFIATDCPISNTYAPEIKRIIAHYRPQKIAFSLIYPDSDVSLADAQKHAKAYGYACPVQIDPRHILTRKTGATITPEVAVLTPEGKLLYRGRIDDLYIGLGQRRYAATQHDLRNALDAVVQGKPVPQRFTHSIGCFIPELAKP